MVMWLNLYCDMHPDCDKNKLNEELEGTAIFGVLKCRKTLINNNDDLNISDEEKCTRWRFENKVQQNNDAASSIFFVEEESEEDFAAAAAARRPVEVTTPSTTTSTTTTTTVKPVETTTNGTDKGRENFTAGCTPGYQRTPDGRCKATFG
nr:unnamed protein product [Spodoptera littoralis]